MKKGTTQNNKKTQALLDDLDIDDLFAIQEFKQRIRETFEMIPKIVRKVGFLNDWLFCGEAFEEYYRVVLLKNIIKEALTEIAEMSERYYDNISTMHLVTNKKTSSPHYRPVLGDS